MLKYIDTNFFYKPELLPGMADIVEVGSFTGKNAIKLHSDMPEAKIIIYEASKFNFGRLEDAVRGYPFTLHNRAVTNEDGKILFHDFRGVPSASSIFPRPRSLLCKDQVPSTSVETIFPDNALDTIDLMLLNCEGAELLILEEILEKNLAPLIKQLCVSFHYDKIYPKGDSDALIEQMKKHYQMISNNEQTREYVLFYNEEST